MLTTKLTVGGKIGAIPGERVAQMEISLSLADVDSGKRTLTKIRKNLGSDEVVLGSYLALGDCQSSTCGSKRQQAVFDIPQPRMPTFTS